MSSISAASLGLSNAMARFTRASNQLVQATSGASEADPAAAIVDQIEAKTQFIASTRTISIADAMTRQLLDIKV